MTGADGKNEKHKINLLDSSERYYIANEVVTRLETISTDLFILAWQVRTLSWNDLWFSLDPEGWANVMSGKNINSYNNGNRKENHRPLPLVRRQCGQDLQGVPL